MFIIVLIFSTQIAYGQSELRRPVFTGGGSLFAGASGKGTALTFGQSFAGNKKNGCQIVQIGAQSGADCDSLKFDSLCKVIGYWNKGNFYPIGIKENKNSSKSLNEITLFPNPTSNIIKLSAATMSSDITIQLFSINGDLVLSEYWKKGETKILNIENLNPAVYLAKFLSTDGKSISKKLINKL